MQILSTSRITQGKQSHFQEGQNAPFAPPRNIPVYVIIFVIAGYSCSYIYLNLFHHQHKRNCIKGPNRKVKISSASIVMGCFQLSKEIHSIKFSNLFQKNSSCAVLYLPCTHIQIHTHANTYTELHTHTHQYAPTICSHNLNILGPLHGLLLVSTL